VRASKKPYFFHPLETALILSELNADSETIAAALLHDVIEDTNVSARRLEKLFGQEVALLVEGVTKVDIISRRGKQAQNIANLQKILLATVSDLRVLFIKLADKLHNLRTLRFLPKQKQIAIARHALEVYAPLAHKLGIHKIKHEMEEICFSVLEPHEYALLKKEIAKRRKHSEPEIKEIIKMVSKNCRVGRALSVYTMQKGVYNIFRKIAATGKSLNEIYDYLIVVILVDSVRECYECLGMIHSMFPPIARKLKDYIAIPQSNGYKSIHTTVIGPRGKPVKIYIRTKEMDDLAEKGMIVAHTDKNFAKAFGKRVSALKKSLVKDLSKKSEKEFLESFKTDFLEDSVFFFDKHGNVCELPFGSTPLDFAFFFGKEDGLHFEKARVNGKDVAPWYEIQSSDIVEVYFSKQIGVNRQWLSFVKSKAAVEAIEKALEKKHAKKRIAARVPPTKLKIVAVDKIGLFLDLAKVFSDNKVNIESLSAEALPREQKAILEINACFCDKKQLARVVARLQKTRNVFDVKVL